MAGNDMAFEEFLSTVQVFLAMALSWGGGGREAEKPRVWGFHPW